VTVVLDAQVLVALMLDEPAAEEVEALLRRSDAAVTTLNLAETVDVLGRVEKLDDDRIQAVLEPLFATALNTLDLDRPTAWRAARMRRRHYHARRSALSMADCVCLAAAATSGSLATADRALARAARAEDIEVIALPDASGKRP
jgi:PIN domain nuclease of toxin-antitoxin system